MKTMKMTTSDRTDFRAMTTNSTLDMFGTRVYNASYSSIKRMTDRFTFIRSDQKYDLACEVMKKACMARSSYDPSKSTIETWVNTIAWRTVCDWLEKWFNHEALAVSYDESSDFDNDDACGEDWRCFRSAPELYEVWYADRELESSDAVCEIEDALGLLSESDRDLAQMLADEVDTEEIADRLGINANALYGRIHKMRKRLQAELGMVA